MRPFVPPVLLVLVAACSSTPPGIEPPPPPPGGTPASLAVAAGNGQEAGAGAVVPVNPSVIVKNAAGTPLAGVTVTFTVDSGGGTITGGTEVTNASGIATLGSWTLGPAQGRNVLRITVTGISPAFITATAGIPLVVLAQNVTIGTGGGTVSYIKPGDPLDGLAITVPTGAYAAATHWTVTAKAGVQVALPAGAFTVGPVIGVTNGMAYADGIMTVRIPMHVGSDTALAAFLYDSNTAVLELVPIVGRDDASITVATRHFSADRLVQVAAAFPSAMVSSLGTPRASFSFASPALPRQSPGASLFSRIVPAAMRTPGPPPFGTVSIVTVGLRQSTLGNIAITTSFAPGVDDWETEDYPNWLTYRGDADGMAVSALYYNYRFKGVAGSLYHRFDRVAGFWDDNPLGIRMNAEVQQDVNIGWSRIPNFLFTMESYAASKGAPVDLVMYQSLLLAMYVTGRAQLLQPYSNVSTGHLLIAFAAQNGRINLADPNIPGTFATITFNGQGWDPHNFSTNSLTAPTPFTNYAAIGTSTIIATSDLDYHWTRFANGTSGSGNFPATSLEYYDATTDTWIPIPASTDTVRIASDTFLVRSNCANCPHQRAASELPARQFTKVFSLINGSIFSTANDAPDFVRGALVRMNPRTQVLGLTSEAYTNENPSGPADWQFEYVNFRWLTVISSALTIDPRTITATVDSTIDYIVAGASYPAGATFNWTFRLNGTTTASSQPTPTLSHTFAQIGLWHIVLKVRDASGVLLSADSTTANIVPMQVLIEPPVFIINQAPFLANPGDPVTFVANIYSTTFRPLFLSYVWKYGEPGVKWDTTNVPTTTHTYQATSVTLGSFPVSLDLLDISGTVIGHGTASAQIKVWPAAWRFTSFVRTAATPLPTTYDTTGSFHAVLDSIDLYMGKVMSIPSDGLLFFADDSGFIEHGVYFMVSRVPGAGSLANYWVSGNYFTMVSRTCCLAGVFTNTGTLTNGTLDGWASLTMFQGGSYNEIHAVKSSTTSQGITTGTLAGTINIWTPFQPYGMRSYQFTAVKVSP